MMVGIVLQKMYCLYLAAGNADHDRVAGLDHVVVRDGLAGIALKASLQTLHVF